MKKFNINTLFFNNKFLIVFSVLIAFISWVVIKLGSSESQERIISNIPVNISLSDNAKNDGLKIFAGGDRTASVTIKGNRVISSMLTKENIRIVAKQASSTIISPGSYMLELTAEKVGNISDFEFVGSVSPHFISVSVDREKSITLKIQDKIKYTSDPAYFAGSTNLSSDTLVISGPETKINKIVRDEVSTSIDGILKKTETVTLPVNLYDLNDQLISPDQLSMNVTSVTATIPILYKKVLNINPLLKNFPESAGIANCLSLEPSTIEIAGPEDTIKDMSSINLEEINSVEVNSSNTSFSKPLVLPEGCKSLNNLYFVKVQITKNLSQKIINVNNIVFSNVPTGKNTKAYTKTISVTVVGSPGDLKQLNPDKVTAEIDMANITEVGDKEVPVTIKVSEEYGCWSYGKYTANIAIS